MEVERKMTDFIAIKSKATILKMLDDEIKYAHKTYLSEKEFNDVEGWDLQGDDRKIHDNGYISALQHLKRKVEEK